MAAKQFWTNPATGEQVAIRYPYKKRGDDGVLREYHADGTVTPVTENGKPAANRAHTPVAVSAGCDDWPDADVTV
jgi:hypothetical protein